MTSNREPSIDPRQEVPQKSFLASDFPPLEPRIKKRAFTSDGTELILLPQERLFVGTHDMDLGVDLQVSSFGE